MINTKIYSTSDRQLPSYCALKCDNKQTKKPNNPLEKQERKNNNLKTKDLRIRFRRSLRKALGSRDRKDEL